MNLNCIRFASDVVGECAGDPLGPDPSVGIVFGPQQLVSPPRNAPEIGEMDGVPVSGEGVPNPSNAVRLGDVPLVEPQIVPPPEKYFAI